MPDTSPLVLPVLNVIRYENRSDGVCQSWNKTREDKIGRDTPAERNDSPSFGPVYQAHHGGCPETLGSIEQANHTLAKSLSSHVRRAPFPGQHTAPHHRPQEDPKGMCLGTAAAVTAATAALIEAALDAATAPGFEAVRPAAEAAASAKIDM